MRSILWYECYPHSYVKNILHDTQKQKAEFWIGTFKIQKRTQKTIKSIIKVLNMTCVPYFLQLYDRFMWWTDWILYLILILLTLSLPSLGLKIKESLNKNNY